MGDKNNINITKLAIRHDGDAIYPWNLVPWATTGCNVSSSSWVFMAKVKRRTWWKRLVQHPLFGHGSDLRRLMSNSKLYSVECVRQQLWLICSTTLKQNMSLNTSINRHCSQPQDPGRRMQDRKNLVQTSIQQSFSKGTPYRRKSLWLNEITRAVILV